MNIAVVDIGTLDPNLPEFAGRIHPVSGDLLGSGRYSTSQHGTQVASVAAAARNGAGMLGVAFGSTLMTFDVSGLDCVPTLCGADPSAFARGIDLAVQNGARAINFSAYQYPTHPEIVAAIQRAGEAGVVLVFAAGNQGTSAPAPNALEFARQLASYGTAILAGAHDSFGQIATFSDRAGDSREYLTALGVQVAMVDNTGQLRAGSGTSFAAPVITGAVALLAEAFPNLTGKQIVEILFKSADDAGAAGFDAVFGNGRLNIASAFQPIGTTSLADSREAVSTTNNGELPAASGDANRGESFGAVILDDYDRAFVLDFARTLRQAGTSRPLSQAIQTGVQFNTIAAGPVTLAMTVAQRHDIPHGYALERMAIGPDDDRRSRLIAGAAIAQLDEKTAAAFGLSEGAKAMERHLSGAEAGAFLIAKDSAGDPGFAASREGSIAMRRNLGPVGLTVSGETGRVWTEMRTSATGSPYRWASVAVDKDFGSSWLSAAISRLEEKQTLLGGRMGNALGGGGSSSLFLDLEARRELGHGFSAGLTARRGWTSFIGGKMQTDAYAFDFTKSGLLNGSDSLGLRIAQPLRVSSGGFAMLLPTAYDYSTQIATSSWTTYSLSPSGREIDTELSYGSSLWDGGGRVGGNLFMRRQPGHIAKADNDYGAAIRFTLGF